MGKEVMEVLDKVTYERDLYASIEERREEMEAHMDITEKLPNEKKIDYKRTYLEMENAALEKLQKEREDSEKKKLRNIGKPKKILIGRLGKRKKREEKPTMRNSGRNKRGKEKREKRRRKRRERAGKRRLERKRS